MEEYSLPTFIIVNAGLYYLFGEKVVTSDTMTGEHLEHYNLCRDNLETALSSMPFFLPSNKETIEALLLGVSSVWTVFCYHSPKSTHPI